MPGRLTSHDDRALLAPLPRKVWELSVLLILLALGVFMVFCVRFRDGLKRSPTVQIGVGAILGGAIGNIVDRIQHLWVVDFNRFKTIWPNIFNFADLAITVGVVVIIPGSLNAERVARRASLE